MTVEEIYSISDENPILFYDGVCNLCNGFVQMVIKHDEHGKIKYCALQDPSGVNIREYLNQKHDISTAIGMYKKQIFTHSDVLFMIARVLKGKWIILRPFQWIPKSIRDRIYNWVAKNRYKWFGQKDSCPVPDIKIKNRFIQ